MDATPKKVSNADTACPSDDGVPIAFLFVNSRTGKLLAQAADSSVVRASACRSRCNR